MVINKWSYLKYFFQHSEDTKTVAGKVMLIFKLLMLDVVRQKLLIVFMEAIEYTCYV